ncbi:hypothetical protein GF345_03450 [Candidatus Woesearchaeota archaeon]|nr:hypothetical protein [Candidatus Woesearchaeota archaeon]
MILERINRILTLYLEYYSIKPSRIGTLAILMAYIAYSRILNKASKTI